MLLSYHTADTDVTTQHSGRLLYMLSRVMDLIDMSVLTMMMMMIASHLEKAAPMLNEGLQHHRQRDTGGGCSFHQLPQPFHVIDQCQTM